MSPIESSRSPIPRRPVRLVRRCGVQVAAGKAQGGYDTINEAAAKMARVKDKSYIPNPAAHAVYAGLFNEYKTLHDYFGCGENDVMKRLKAMKTPD